MGGFPFEAMRIEDRLFTITSYDKISRTNVANPSGSGATHSLTVENNPVAGLFCGPV